MRGTHSQDSPRPGDAPDPGRVVLPAAAADPGTALPRLDRSFRDHRDPFFADTRAGGELLVARLRLVLAGVLWASQLLSGFDPRQPWLVVQFNGVVLVVAFLVYVLAWRAYRPWVSFVSTAADLTLVSAGILVSTVVERGQEPYLSRLAFDAYFLAIAGASLRYNWRVSILAGVLAIAQYGAIVWYAESGGPRPDSSLLSQEALRLALLAAATVLSTAIVLRARRLRQISTTDRLTGIANRGALDERLREETSRARRYERPFTVAIIDVDHFKRFNDAHGHAGGDVVLRVLADTLVASVRSSDTVARYGGEEFALILAETNAPAAMNRLEALRQIIGAVPIDTGRGTGPVGVTVSIGVASWPDDGIDPTEVLARADARLYEAKRSGRNRTAGPGADSPDAPPGGPPARGPAGEVSPDSGS